MGRVVSGSFAATAALALLLSACAPAGASAAPSTEQPGTTVVTALFADCSRVTVGGREYARRHGIDLCGADTTPLTVPLRTEAVGGEECGTLTLTATSWGGGVAAVGWTVASRVGPLSRVDLELSVAGRAGITHHRFTGRPGDASGRAGVIDYVGAGPAVATISGTVETATGVCALVSAPARIGVR